MWGDEAEAAFLDLKSLTKTTWARAKWLLSVMTQKWCHCVVPAASCFLGEFSTSAHQRQQTPKTGLISSDGKLHVNLFNWIVATPSHCSFENFSSKLELSNEICEDRRRSFDALAFCWPTASLVAYGRVGRSGAKYIRHGIVRRLDSGTD